MNKHPSIPVDSITVNAAELRALRMRKRESQTQFWNRFGVSQSRGSRFELGMEMPFPIAILLRLYFDGAVSDSDLHSARFTKPPRRQTMHQAQSALSQG
jgi:hypothetical protein